MPIINGLDRHQLTFSSLEATIATDNDVRFIDAFVDKNVADVTIDANANASNKDIRSLMSEQGKPHDKLRSCW